MSESHDSAVSKESSPTATELSIVASGNTFGDGSSHGTNSPRPSLEAASTQSLASSNGTEAANSSNPGSISPTAPGFEDKRQLDSSCSNSSSPEEMNDEDIRAEISRLDQELKKVEENLNASIAAANAYKEEKMAKKKILEEKIKNKVRRKSKTQTHFTGGFSSFLKHRFKSNDLKVKKNTSTLLNKFLTVE